MDTNAGDFFPVFAEWATRSGLEDAIQRFRTVLGADLDQYVEEFKRRIERTQRGFPPVILTAPNGDDWYPGPLEVHRHWPALTRFLVDDLSWPTERVRLVNEASSKIVSYTPDPSRSRWKSKGLVVGYVQSGKTTNFTSVIAKAVDAGYKLVIVLSGIHNGLRRQTQVRLDEQLVHLNQDLWFALTDENRDFYAPAAAPSAYLIGNDPKAVLCVVKKNAAVLRRLKNWLDRTSRTGDLAKVKALVIDDEADQASVATARINPLIREILDRLPSCTYIGYTATPFANVLIDPSEDDLYPSDFILNLPRPEGYFGPQVVFGRDAVEGDEAIGADLDGFDMVRVINQDEIADLRPVSNATVDGFVPDITPSLADAVRWFWLATAARRARGDRGHSTMLVHTSVKIAVHDSYRDPLRGVRASALSRLDRGDSDFISELRAQWTLETGKVPADEFGLGTPSFEDVASHLRDVVASTTIVLDNCRSQDRLVYGDEPVVAIAVGGNTLSRGLTLEGLVVSFFIRAAQAYDTLLQMGRWFGFRTGYEDLPRIWMTEELRGWFRHLATVEHEIRLDIDRYEQQGLTPVEFGVRIRTHPVLRVTTKMGAARTAYASYGGRRVQTRYFKENDAAWLQGRVPQRGVTRRVLLRE